jgi:MinD superfamily P-loop ATPase
VDADAEAPDAAVTLPVRWQPPTTVHLRVPVIDTQRCDGCGACAAGCQFNALAMAGGKPLVFADLCHGCGACALICKEHGAAIHEQPFPIGSVRRGAAAWGELIEARTAVGVARASQVISAALTEAGPYGCQIVDGPPGTSCSAVAALTGADLALVVVESTPFGRHDATLAVQLVRNLGIPLRIVLNRCTPEDVGESQVWCAQQNASIAATINEDPDLDLAGAQGLDPWQHAQAFAAVCRTLGLVLTTELAQPCLEPAHAY